MLQKVWISKLSLAKFTTNVLGKHLLPLNYEDMKKVIESNDVSNVIVDVRSKYQYDSSHIPGAFSIPRSEFTSALTSKNDTFFSKYGFKKPTTDKTMIIYCNYGIQAASAADEAVNLGYKYLRSKISQELEWEAKSTPMETQIYSWMTGVGALLGAFFIIEQISNYTRKQNKKN
ncbi:hypothetical protein HK098_007581 [Nowakowskiella sp. JEL0407]|nr:hypothetical protein HK098_007581 [Nowakowskiella sp. JEL0407]